nr:uncharacterized protein LOC109738867 [Aegilops tauschii subsp. strangulata]
MQESRSDREKGENLDSHQMYLVYGESSQKVKLQRPGYTLHLNVVNPGSLITLDKISDCPGHLLSSSNSNTNSNSNNNSNSDSKSNKYKDMSLAFTLSRLLRCRLEDATLHQDIKDEICGLIISKVTGQEKMEAKRIFRILQWELGFVRDYFYTLYPMVFCQGLSSLCFSVLLSMVTFAAAFWLAISIRKAYEPTEETVVLWVGGWNVDVIITWVFLFMMFKEVWEIITYLLSNWTRLLLVCKYVQQSMESEQRQRSRRSGRLSPTEYLISLFFASKIALTESMTSLLFVSKIADPWDGQIDQYDFLQSCTYNPSFWEKAKSVTLGKTARKLDGRICGEPIKISECVKKAILQALGKIGLNNDQLPREIPSLNAGNHFQRYKWACMDLDTCSQVILVWHIATSFCQIKLVKEGEIDLSKPGFVSSAWSYLKTLCRPSKPCIVDDKIQKQLDLKTNYDTATSLSRYCAYLRVFRPELLPDSFVVPDLIFLETLQKAQEQADDCNLKWCWYNKLMVVAQEAAENNQDAARNHVDRRLSMNIVQQGATLGKDLISMDKEMRWQILAGVWADLFVHIAPSWNAVDHKNNLESGGEFITLIWALLCHCGIEKSSMWKNGKVCESNAQVQTSNTESTEEQQESESNAQVSQENNTETSNTEPMEQQEFESDAPEPQENNTETSNIEPEKQHKNLKAMLRCLRKTILKPATLSPWSSKNLKAMLQNLRKIILKPATLSPWSSKNLKAMLKYLRKIILKPATLSPWWSNQNLKAMLKYLRKIILKPATPSQWTSNQKLKAMLKYPRKIILKPATFSPRRRSNTMRMRLSDQDSDTSRFT